MEDLGSIMKSRMQPKEPQEGRLLKAYVMKKYATPISVMYSEHSTTMVVPHAALAGSLRLELADIIAACHITKKLQIRIG